MANSIKRPVRILREDVARRIAAGEVIDRPSAIVRELMDNAVDCGANSITVEIKEGGIESIKVSDNGFGMTRDDLENCANPHATSKIVEADDLSKLTTLGFRGEALASIAAVSELSISSANLMMTLSNGKPRKIETIPLFQDGKGTCVSSSDLFADFPARRVFLKRPATETMMCREVFLEKALPRTDISFRLIIDNSIKVDLPSNVSKAQRFSSALEIKENLSFLHELNATGKESDGKTDWKFSLVIGSPEIRRNNKRSIFIYVNGRRIQEYSLFQAIEYGCQGFFPNGTHPVAALFAEVSPSLVDFNIHPAKREVKFRDISSLHHGISSTLRAYFRSLTLLNTNEKDEDDNNDSFLDGILSSTITNDTNERTQSQNNLQSDNLFEKIANSNLNSIEKTNKSELSRIYENTITQNKNTDSIKISDADKGDSNDILQNTTNVSTKKKSDLRSRFFSFDTSIEKRVSSNDLFSEQSNIEETFTQNGQTEQTQVSKNESFQNSFKYLGRTMETFIMLERKNELYFVDQHAAHERIIFDKMMNGEDDSVKSKQTLLIPYRIETDDTTEENYIDSLLVELEKCGFTGKNIGNGVFEFSTISSKWSGTQKDFKDAILQKMVEPNRIMYKVFAMAACRKAVMQGTPLDDKTAEEIARKALTLPDPHCPHGRPIWFTMTKEQMFARVRRTEN